MDYPRAFAAHHEAGHAVIDLRLGFEVEMVTIKGDRRRGSEGYTACIARGRSWEVVGDGRIRLSDEWCEKYIKSALAGKIAESLVNPDPPKFGWEGDWQRARRYARIMCDTRQERNELLDRMKRETTTLVLANRAAIERVAGALMERETLMRDEIAALAH
jgi:ATP-dependent Zn protease